MPADLPLLTAGGCPERQLASAAAIAAAVLLLLLLAWALLQVQGMCCCLALVLQADGQYWKILQLIHCVLAHVARGC